MEENNRKNKTSNQQRRKYLVVFENMNILLTGGDGFIGRNIYQGIKDDYKVFIPSHKELELMDEKAVREYIVKNKIKVVIHAAIKTGDQVLESILRMYYSIYKNLDLLDQFINFGSGAEYSKTRDLKKVKEEDLGENVPQDNYGLGKLICNQLSKRNKKIVTLLPFGIFGPGEDYRFKFISNSIVKNLLGLPIKIKQNVVFDYLYISDLTEIIKFFLSNNKYYGDYNLTTTQSISLTEIVDIINKISDRPSIVSVINKRMNFQYTGSNDKLKKTIKKLFITSYEEAIKKLYQYYSAMENIDKNSIIEDKYLKIVKTKT